MLLKNALKDQVILNLKIINYKKWGFLHPFLSISYLVNIILNLSRLSFGIALFIYPFFPLLFFDKDGFRLD